MDQEQEFTKRENESESSRPNQNSNQNPKPLHAPNAWTSGNGVSRIRSLPPLSSTISIKAETNRPRKDVLRRHPFDKRHKRVLSCVKCGNDGHVFRDCTGPATSYGIIAFRQATHTAQEGPVIQQDTPRCALHTHQAPDRILVHNPAYKLSRTHNLHYLMVQRKDTMGYIDFIRGKWPEHDEPTKQKLLRTYLQEMTCAERTRLLTLDFDSLWDLMWTDHSSRIYINDGLEAKVKYETLDIPRLLAATMCCWTEQEYGFPKGRKRMLESYLDSAKREFLEETGYGEHQYRILSEKPWEEVFIGTNGLAYRHIYYVAEMLSDEQPCVPMSEIQRDGEISNMAWFTYEQCEKVIRPYDVAKKDLIATVHRRYKHYYDEIKR